MSPPVTKPRIFITGATGYVAGSFLHLMLSRDYLTRYDIAVLVRQPKDVQRFSELGISPVLGSHDEHALLEYEASQSDVVSNTASCDHMPSIISLIRGLRRASQKTGRRPILIHTSGAGVLSGTSVGTGQPLEKDPAAQIWDDADQQGQEVLSIYCPGQNAPTVSVHPTSFPPEIFLQWACPID